ncbi:putative chromatin-remodeling complex ATPase chain [Tanacetum coccineum]
MRVLSISMFFVDNPSTHKMSFDPFLLRRLKSDVEKGLPPKKETILKVGMSQMQKQYYKALLQKDLEGLTVEEAEENEKKGKLRVEVEDYKAKREEAIVGKLADKGDKIRNQISELNLELCRLQTSEYAYEKKIIISKIEDVINDLKIRNVTVYTTDFPDTPPLVVDYTNISNSFDESGLLFAPKLTSVKRVRFNATANIRKKMTKEERKALIKAGREDSV